MSILLGFPAARRHRVPPPCRTAYDGADRALPLWITSPQRFGCGQLFAIRTVMRKDAGFCLAHFGLAGWREVGLEVVEAGYFLGGQGEAEQVEVLLDALGAGGPGDDDDADVDVPAQDDLGRGDTVLAGDLGQRTVAQPGALERAVALERNAAFGVRGQQAGVVPGRAPRDLVDGGPLPRRIDQVVDLADAVVADPDGPGQAVVPGRQELTPQRHQVPAPRRPVHQPQVHVVRA